MNQICFINQTGLPSYLIWITNIYKNYLYEKFLNSAIT